MPVSCFITDETGVVGESQKTSFVTFLQAVLKMEISLPQFTSPGRGFLKAVVRKRAVVWKPVKENKNCVDKKTTSESVGYSKGPGKGVFPVCTDSIYDISVRGCMRIRDGTDCGVILTPVQENGFAQLQFQLLRQQSYKRPQHPKDAALRWRMRAPSTSYSHTLSHRLRRCPSILLRCIHVTGTKTSVSRTTGAFKLPSSCSK